MSDPMNPRRESSGSISKNKKIEHDRLQEFEKIFHTMIEARDQSDEVEEQVGEDANDDALSGEIFLYNNKKL